jgi:tRNA(Ile)-lysidine synthase
LDTRVSQMTGGQGRIPVLLMVSGGSDSTALLELAAKYLRGSATISFKLDESERLNSTLLGKMGEVLPPPERCAFYALHVNHMLRGTQADDDEAFVRAHCENYSIPCEVRRVDVAALAAKGGQGIEATAHELRYRLADEVLDSICERVGVPPEQGLICTAHTLDDRIETFFMRSLVGTGPGGLGSIARVQGRVRRPLLGVLREELRSWLRSRHAGCPDYELWRDDPTNEDGSNFRSRVRMQAMPVMRSLRPGFERSLERTMDLIASEDADLADQARSLLYRNLSWDGQIATLPVDVLESCSRSLARRLLRAALLVVAPSARLESAQIERVLSGYKRAGFVTEVSGGVRVTSDGKRLVMRVAQPSRLSRGSGSSSSGDGNNCRR